MKVLEPHIIGSDLILGSADLSLNSGLAGACLDPGSLGGRSQPHAVFRLESGFTGDVFESRIVNSGQMTEVSGTNLP